MYMWARNPGRSGSTRKMQTQRGDELNLSGAQLHLTEDYYSET